MYAQDQDEKIVVIKASRIISCMTDEPLSDTNKKVSVSIADWVSKWQHLEAGLEEVSKAGEAFTLLVFMPKKINEYWR